MLVDYAESESEEEQVLISHSLETVKKVEKCSESYEPSKVLEVGDEGNDDFEDKKLSLCSKFNELKERRTSIVKENNIVRTSFIKPRKTNKQKRITNEIKESSKFAEINACMTETFTVKCEEDTNPYKKSKLELEMDTAIDKGDFLLAEQLSDEIEKRRFAVQVKGAMAARNYSKFKQKKEANKSQRKKLKWAFNPKERWETKGNMCK